MNSLNPAVDWIDFIAYDGLSATEAAEKMKNIEACCILITYIFLYFSTIQKKTNTSERISPRYIALC